MKSLTNSILSIPLFMVLFALVSGCGGCDDETTGSAEVTIRELDPTSGYQGVETTVFFEITPGESTNAEDMEWRVNFGDGSQVSGQGADASAAHTFESSGRFEIEVSAIFGGANVGSATASYQVFAPVDLQMESVRGAPANVNTGDELTVSTAISNAVASDVLTPFSVNLYLSESADVVPSNLPDLIEIGSFEVPGSPEDPVIETGETIEPGTTVSIPEELNSGDYFIVAVADPDEKVGDTDRENNLLVSTGVIRVENTADSLPDVGVENLFAIPDRAFPRLNQVTRGFTLVNRGSVDAFEVVHRTYLSVGDADLDESDLLINTSSPVTLFGGDEVEIGPDEFVLDNEIIPPANEELTVYLIVVAESTEDGAQDANPANNLAVADPPTVVADQPVDGPDIVVRSFSVTPNSTFLNGTLEIDTSIANEGTVGVGSFFCGIYLGAAPRVNTQNDPRLVNINIPSLDASEVIDRQQSITIPGLYDPGVYYIYMVCDPLNALSEAFRSNNNGINLDPITITDMADVDLIVQGLDVPADVNEGEMFTLTTTVCVEGSNPSGSTRAAIYRNAGTAPTYTGEPLVRFDIPNTNPGDCTEIETTIEASCLDFVEQYAFGVVVDTENTLPERDESNNRKAGFNLQTVAGTYCACTEDGFEPNDRSIDAVPVTAGTTSAALCAGGTCDYFAVDLLSNESLIVNTLFDASKGGLTTTLFDPSGIQVLDTSASAEDQTVAIFLTPQDGRYIFRVCGSTSTARNFYDLAVSTFAPANGVDLLPRDVTIPAGGPFSVGTPLDVNSRLYNVGTAAAGSFNVQVVVSPDTTFGDANDTAVATQVIAGLPAGGFTDLTIRATLPTSLTDGDYYIGVVADPFAQITEVDVTNNVAVSRQFGVRTTCYDPLEPNDTLGTAADVADGTYSNLVVCDGADDYYRICPNDAQKFTVTATFDENVGDIDLFLSDDQQNQVDASASSAGVEEVSVDYVNGAQCYTVRAKVIGLSSMETPYELDVDIQDVDPSLRCDSVFEPNDSFTTASSLAAALAQTFALDRCPVADSDMYYVDLTAGQTVTFRASLNPTLQQGTLRLQVYQPTQVPGPNIETAPGVPTAEIKDYVAPRTGRFFVQVTVSGTQRKVTYDLEAEGLGGIDLAPSAFVIGPGTYAPLDEVRFGYTLSNLGTDPATGVQYSISFGDSASPDAANDTALGTFTAGDVAGNASLALNDKVFVPSAATGGQHYLHLEVDPADVAGDSNRTNNVITIPISIAP